MLQPARSPLRASPLRVPSLLARLTFATTVLVTVASSAQTDVDLSPERVAPGVISTTAVEHDFALFPDQLTALFSRRTGRWGEMGQRSTIHIVRKGSAEGWGEVTVAPFSGRFDDGDAFVSPDGRRVLFVSSRPVPDGSSRAREIWEVSVSDGRWSEPKHLGSPISGEGLEMGPSLSDNGNLYFSSDRAGGHGAGDLYRALWRNGVYQSVENLGSTVNGPSGEWNVVVAPDESYIIFESSGRPGALGPGGDLYLSYRQGAGWGQPIHLAAISTPGSDLMPRISPDGQRLYYATSWTAGGADVDIVSVSLEDLLQRYPAQPPKPALTGLTPAQLEDLAAFENGFFEVDRSYTPAARAEAKKRIADLRALSVPVTNARFVLTLSQIAALADNGHSGVLYRGGAPELGRVGVRLHSFEGEFIVVHAAADLAGLLGGRLVAVDATPIAKLREAGRTLNGGVIPRRDLLANAFLESPGQLHALGLARAGDRARYAFEWSDGRRREAVLEVISPPGGARDSTLALLSPERAPAGWRSLLPAANAPWSIVEIRETMRRQDRPDLDAMVIQLRANVDGVRPISEFLDESEDSRRKAGRRHVILDMRMNGGGDLTRTRRWMAALPGRLPADGRVVVLTSASTFSAAISSVGYLKQAGKTRVTLVGEPPGDRLNFFAEGRPITLPNSGAVVLMAKERHDYRTGCRGYADCHSFVARNPIAVPSFDPDVPAPWTLDDYVAGRDPGMEAAARVIRAPEPRAAVR